MSTFVAPGLEALRVALRSLPTELAGEAEGIVREAAEAAADEARAAYPERAASLRAAVVVVQSDAGTFGAAAAVRNTSRLAWLYEYGSQVRHTSIGANRGPMKAARSFVPPMQTHRRAMYTALAELVRSHGITVTGG